MKFLITLNILILLVCCAKESNRKSTYVTEYFEDTEIIEHQGTIVKGKWEGIHKWYYPSGNISIINNYSKSVENGFRHTFYDSSKLLLLGEHVYTSGNLVKTSYFHYNGKVKEFDYYDSNFNLIRKECFNQNEKLIKIKHFSVVHWGDKPVYDSWFNFDTLNNVIENESHGIEILEQGRSFYKDSTYEIDIKYYSLYKDKHKVIYGKINDVFSFNDTNVIKKSFQSNNFSIPLNTKDTGVYVQRFIVIDYAPLTQEEVKKGYQEKMHPIHCEFQYNVKSK